MIGNSNYIGTCLNRLIRNQNPKELNPFQFLQKKIYINNNDGTAHFFGHSKLTPLDIFDFYEIKQTNENMETEMKVMNKKLVENPFNDNDNFNELIPIQIRKERTKEAYKDIMNEDIETIEKMRIVNKSFKKLNGEQYMRL